MILNGLLKILAFLALTFKHNTHSRSVGVVFSLLQMIHDFFEIVLTCHKDSCVLVSDSTNHTRTAGFYHGLEGPDVEPYLSEVTQKLMEVHCFLVLVDRDDWPVLRKKSFFSLLREDFDCLVFNSFVAQSVIAEIHKVKI